MMFVSVSCQWSVVSGQLLVVSGSVVSGQLSIMNFSSITIAFFAYGVISSGMENMLTPQTALKNQAIATTEKPEQAQQLKQSQNVDSSRQKLIQCLQRVRNSRPNHNSSTIPSNNLNNSAVGSGSGIGIGSGSGIGVGSGSGIGNKPTNPSTNNRASCRDCRTQYPASARHQGIQGRVEVAIDTDAQGNVINVRLTRSSGNRELDEETLRQARNWKLKPASGGRQGVSVGTEYAIRGTCRYKEFQERRRGVRSRVR